MRRSSSSSSVPSASLPLAGSSRDADAGAELAGVGRRHLGPTAGGLQQYYLAVDQMQYKMATLVDLLEVVGAHPSLPLSICCGTRDSLDAVVTALTDARRLSPLTVLHSDMAEADRSLALDTFRRASSSWWRRRTENQPPATAVSLSRDGDVAAATAQPPVPGPSGGPSAPPRASASASSAAEPPGPPPTGAEASTSDSVQVASPSAQVLVCTDACIPSPASGEAALGARLLVNYDLPLKKEGYVRRIAGCLGSGPAGSLSGSKAGALREAGSGGPAAAGGMPPPQATAAAAIVINFVIAGDVALLRHLEESCGSLVEEMPINIMELL